MLSQLERHLDWSFEKADKYESNIDPEILDMEGMSGKKTRHFYNNVCSMKDARYLEIGVWKGSSLCSAMSNNNDLICLGIDNWSEFDGPKDKFMVNYDKYKVENAKFMEENCWNVFTDRIGKFNIYMYDGQHSQQSHYFSLKHYLNCLDDIFIFLVDDWNWVQVQRGTLESIENNNLKTLYKREIFTNGGVHPPSNPGPGDRAGKDGDWHNGICIFILQKS